MNIHTRILSAFAWCVLAFVGINTHAQTSSPQPATQEKITVEWVFSAKSREAAIVPATHWFSDGTALFYDIRQPAASRTWERLDPKTGKKTAFCDMAKLKASMKALRGTEDVAMPTFNKQGSYGIIDMGEELLLVNIAANEIKSILKGAADEYTRFSPDGMKIAFVRNHDLYVYDITKQAETRLTNDGAETILNGELSWVYWEEVYDRAPEGYYWSEDSKSIAFYQSDESSVTVLPFQRFKPAVPEVIKQRYPKAGGANPKVRMGILDLDKPAQPRWLDVGTAGIDPKFEYFVRAKWTPDNRLSVETLTRDQRELTLYLADRVTAKTTKILTETDSGWVNTHDDLYFMNDGKHFLWASERTGSNHIYRYTMDGKLVNAVTQGKWSVGEARGGAIAAVDEKNGILYFKAIEKSSVERHLYKIKLDGTKMQRLTEETGSHGITFSPDASYFFDRYSNIGTPPSLSLYAVNKGEAKRASVLAPARTEVVAQQGIQLPTLFTIPLADGYQMPAQILKPKDFDANKRYPIIVHVYGGPSAPVVANRWIGGDYYYYQMLLDAGYLIVEMDNRSAAAISKAYENTCLKQLGENELNDLVAGVQWLKKQSYVDSSRVGMWGWSFGGYFTLAGMTRSKEFKAGIAVAAPTDWRYYDTKYTEAMMKTPQDNQAGYDKTNLTSRAKDLHGRLLLVHGTGDDNVHPQNAWHFIDELVKAGKLFDLAMYPMRKHGISDPPARIHLYKTMLEFWKKNL